MPTYEYKCTKCGARCEIFQRMSDPPAKKCEKCGDPEGLKRMISSGGGIIFKGSGFYATDYPSNDYKNKVASAKNGVTTESNNGKKPEKEKMKEKKKEQPAEAEKAVATSSSKD